VDKATFTPSDKNENVLVDRLVAAMKEVFGNDTRRINHALAVLNHAREIMEKEQSVDSDVVVAAAVLHDIGILEAERKYGSSAGVYQEKEGPPIAEPIMKKMGMDEKRVEHVKKIIANHHSARDIDTREFRILWDSDWLVNIPDEYPGIDKEQLTKKIEKIFRTRAGKQKAYELFLRGRAS
jgi:HD superfamily phosphodiesterase